MVDASKNLVIKIGEGSFSKVLKISEDRAIKHFILNLTNNYLSAIDKEKLEEELISAKDFKGKVHQNIVTIYEAEKTNETISWKIELCDTNLKTLLKDLDNPKQAVNEFIAKKRIINLKERIIIVSDLVEGWKFLYANKITHRNLKPENILINFKNGEIRAKISDWGLSKVLDPKFVTPKILRRYLFIAPEYENLEEFDDRFDVWAMGMIIFLIIYGKYPFIRLLNEDALRSKEKWQKVIKKAE